MPDVHRVDWTWAVCVALISASVYAQEIPRLEGHAATVYAVQTSRDAKTFLSGDVAGTVIGWDWETKKPLQRYALGDRAILNLAVSPDNRQFAPCTVDGKGYL